MEAMAFAGIFLMPKRFSPSLKLLDSPFWVEMKITYVNQRAQTESNKLDKDEQSEEDFSSTPPLIR